MPSVANYSPLQYRPTDTNMGRWKWEKGESPATNAVLKDQHNLSIATICQLENGYWHTRLEALGLAWLDLISDREATAASQLLGDESPSMQVAATKAEQVAAKMAIAAGECPDPAHIPVAFIMGKTRSSLHYLEDLEDLARKQEVEPHQNGSLSKLPGDAPPGAVNPVAQARALDQMFKLPKGHWPPRTDVIDDCIDLDSRYAPEYLARAAEMGLVDKD